MPSMRRMRVSGFVIFAVFLYILYISSTTRHSRDPDFYTRTKTALASSDRDKSSQLPKQQGQQQILQPIDPSRKTSSNGQDEAVAVAMAQRLKDAENVAKDNANAKAPTRESVMGDEKAKNTVEDLGSGGKDRNVAGRKKVPVDDVVKEQKTPEQLAEEKEVEADLNGFFKRSPSMSIPFTHLMASTVLDVVGASKAFSLFFLFFCNFRSFRKLMPLSHSNNIFQVLLSAFQTSQRYPP